MEEERDHAAESESKARQARISNRAFLKRLPGVSLLVALTTSCGKSDAPPAEQKAIEQHKKRVEQKQQPNMQWMRPKVDTTIEAAIFAKKLLEQGQLPDATNDGTILMTDVIAKQSTNYPMYRSFRFHRKGEAFVNHYTVAKGSVDSPWKLSRAWKTYTNHNVVKEFDIQ